MVVCFLFVLSGEHLSLAQSEVEHLFNKEARTTGEKLLLINTTRQAILKKAPRLALTKSIHHVINIVDSTNLRKVLQALPPLKNTYKLSLYKETTRAPFLEELSNAVYAQLKKPRVDLHTPQHHYTFFCTPRAVLLGEELYVNTDKPKERRAHLQIHNHPTAINPKFARTMINLANEKTIYDPFCGLGGIILEAKLMGVTASGSDISQVMVEKAKENLAAYSCKAKLQVKDAKQLATKTDGIVTDLPYGKNSLLSEPIDMLYKQFFIRAAKVTKKIVVCYSAAIDVKRLLYNTKWSIVESHELYVHKSLTRVISVLEQ